MRKNFAEILEEAQIDIKEEYHKLYDMLFSPSFNGGEGEASSLHDALGDTFILFNFRGTCLSIQEFDEKNGFEFKREPENFCIDSLISICEYMFNMLLAYDNCSYKSSSFPVTNMRFFLSQINSVIEAVGYMRCTKDGFIIFVEKSPAAISVAETISEPKLSYRVIEYNHYSMKGNLEAKRNTLLLFADDLEPRRSELKKIDQSLTSDLFYAFNKFSIRHNNTASNGNQNYSRVIAEMNRDELEHWYDETYQMCLLAYLQLEQAKRKAEFDRVKDRIENNQ